MKKFKKSITLSLTVSGLFVLPSFVQGKDTTDIQMGMGMMQLNESRVNEVVSTPSTPVVAQTSESVWGSLRKNFRIPEVNRSLIRQHESKMANNSAYFNRTIMRSQPYMYHIATEVQKRGMPAEIALLPFIESAFVINARSRTGASGLWQFMPATGRHYGLEQTPLYDGRRDVYASTTAALNYLQYLYSLFNDWSLALAAYNWGEGNVSRAVRQAQASGITPTYENLRMPSETRNYVPKLLAVRNIVNAPQSYGLNLPHVPHAPYFEPVSIQAPLDIRSASALAGISESEFLLLNPAYKTSVFLPKGSRKMLLPAYAVKTFEVNLKNIGNNNLTQQMAVATPQAVAPSVVNNNATLQNRINMTNIAQEITLMQQRDVDNRPDTFVVHQPVLPAGALAQQVVSVQQNLNLSGVAEQAIRDSQARLNKANRVVINESRHVKPVEIKIPAPKVAKADDNNEPKKAVVQHKVGEGDTLYNIAKRYNISVAELITSNQIKGNKVIRTGQVLKISSNQAVADLPKKATKLAENNTANALPDSYTVKRGDTLHSIARRYNIKVNDIKKLNKGNLEIKTGQVLKLASN